MEWQQYGHSHPLVSSEDQTNPASCARCGEVVSGPSFSCSESECEFYLHKKCAEAPSQIHHPFHSNHPLLLLSKHPYGGSGWCTCSFCGEECELFLYHCSCEIDLHIKCALFSLNIAVNKLGELETVAIKDPLVSTEDGDKELERSLCFVCGEPLLTSLYFSLDCGFNLHKGCAELPHEINHPFHNKHPLTLQFSGEHFSCNICPKNASIYGLTYVCSPCTFALHIKCALLQLPPQISLRCHRKHPLVLQFNSENLPCKGCQEPQDKNFVYCCSSCKFALHIGCASPPLTIKEKSHQHPFTLFWKPVPFICDACGLEGNYVAYTCSTCSLQIHKKCISLPPIIRVPRHHHPIFHNYFLQETQFKNWDCSFCDAEVNTEYGSYYCSESDCNFISHVKCATEKEGWYYVVDAKDKDEKLDDDGSLDPITRVIEKNEGGELTKIKHFSHAHDLILSDNTMVKDKYCDACMLLISNSFYYCSSLCDFFLHQTCSKLLRKKNMWFHRCLKSLVLVRGYIFLCDYCKSEGSGFFYKCNPCSTHICLPCAVRDYRFRHQGHKHPLFFNRNYEGQCSGCGIKRRGRFRCGRCNFNLGTSCCLKLPLTARHSCDEHPLALTYHEGNDYSKFHYCDICEGERDPNFWFYYCAICETSAHPPCVLGRYPFIKAGSVYKETDHPHPLSFVRKAYNYPAACRKCCKPCQDLALECPESTCSYIVHWECAKPPDFRYDGQITLYKTQADAMADHS